MKDLIFYTDGACSGNPGIGGWSYVELVKCDSGFKTSVTKGNNSSIYGISKSL